MASLSIFRLDGEPGVRHAQHKEDRNHRRGGGSTVSHANFSLSVALQYLLWGCIGPLAAKLAMRFGSEVVLATGGLYALGFWGASHSTGTVQFILCTGVLIGAGLGLANYGVVNGLLSMSVDPTQRGRALGIVGSLTALGQLVLLIFTHWTLGHTRDWRAAFELHATLVGFLRDLVLICRHCFLFKEAPLPPGPGCWLF